MLVSAAVTNQAPKVSLSVSGVMRMNYGYFGGRITHFALNWKIAAERVVFKTWIRGAILAKFVEKINNTLTKYGEQLRCRPETR